MMCQKVNKQIYIGICILAGWEDINFGVKTEKQKSFNEIMVTSILNSYDNKITDHFNNNCVYTCPV